MKKACDIAYNCDILCGECGPYLDYDIEGIIRLVMGTMPNNWMGLDGVNWDYLRTLPINSHGLLETNREVTKALSFLNDYGYDYVVKSEYKNVTIEVVVIVTNKEVFRGPINGFE